MASVSRFWDVLEKELKAHIHKAVPEKTKIATKYDIKVLKGNEK